MIHNHKRKVKLKQILISVMVAFTFVLSACTPAEVIDAYADLGYTLSQEEAENISALTERDCLPRYEADQYTECAVADAAARYDVSKTLLADLAWCESRFDDEAYNPSSATGLFQFITSTWNNIAKHGAPYSYLPRTNARANAFNAAWLISRDDLGGISHWNASKGCWS